jgi:hypothetical protein
MQHVITAICPAVSKFEPKDTVFFPAKNSTFTVKFKNGLYGMVS